MKVEREMLQEHQVNQQPAMLYPRLAGPTKDGDSMAFCDQGSANAYRKLPILRDASARRNKNDVE